MLVSSQAMVHNFTLLKEGTAIFEVGTAATRAGPSTLNRIESRRAGRNKEKRRETREEV